MATLIGGSGADTLTGGGPNNVLTGSAGSDVFVYSRFSSDTTITDFGSTYFTATLSGGQEVPPNPSLGTGTFTGELNRARTIFSFDASIANLDLAGQTPATTDNITAAHFHLGPPGASGGIVFGFLGAPNNDIVGVTSTNPTTGAVSSQWLAGEGNAGTTLAAQVPNLLAGQLYLNFHTTVIPAGEIRGQVLPVDTGADRIDLSSVGIGDFETLNLVARTLSSSTTISTSFNGQVANLILQGVPLANLTAADFIFADASPKSVTGTVGADDLFGSGGADTLTGDDGGDRLFGGGGGDRLDGGAGNDTMTGQAGNDSGFGGAGNDTLQGNVGADSLSGGDGNDSLAGGRDNDQLFGDAGTDTVNGDLGSDNLWGGAGADRFVFRAGTGADWVIDFNFAEGDRLQLTTGTTFTQSLFQNQVILTLSTGDAIGLAGVSTFANEFVVFG